VNKSGNSWGVWNIRKVDSAKAERKCLRIFEICCWECIYKSMWTNKVKIKICYEEWTRIGSCKTWFFEETPTGYTINMLTHDIEIKIRGVKQQRRLTITRIEEVTALTGNMIDSDHNPLKIQFNVYNYFFKHNSSAKFLRHFPTFTICHCCQQHGPVYVIQFWHKFNWNEAMKVQREMQIQNY